MSDKPTKRFLFASDFDHTLTFNDSGYILSELLGIPTGEFEQKAAGMASLNFVQQGAELAYLLLHDPMFRGRVRREHLHEVGKRIRLKQNIELLYQTTHQSQPGAWATVGTIDGLPAAWRSNTSGLEGRFEITRDF